MKNFIMIILIIFMGVPYIYALPFENCNAPIWDTYIIENSSDTKELNLSTNILYVNINVSGGNGSGDSWANAIPQLADALKWAKQNQDPNWAATPLQIWVAGGTYLPLYSPEDGTNFADGGRDNTFLLVKDVQVYGGFAGMETTLAERDLSLTTNESILSGDFNGDDVVSGSGSTLSFSNNGENAYHVVVSSGDVGIARLDGFAIRHGNANVTNTIIVNSYPIRRHFGGGMVNHGSSPEMANVILSGNNSNNGGGMHNNSSSPSLTDVTISGNLAMWGGGMHNKSSSPVLSDVMILDNSATITGGGMFNVHSSSPTLMNVTISGNSAGWGGGISNNSSSPILTNVTISDNSTVNEGGGMYNVDASSPVLTDIAISGNSANIGGGIYNYSSSPILTNVTISENSATGVGGGMHNHNSSSSSLTNVTISGNSAGWGGGISNNSSSPTLMDVMILDNSATTNGGGMFNVHSSSPILTNVTISENSTTNEGGGMYNLDASSPNLMNVTILGNSAEWGGGIYNTSSSSPDITNVTISGNSATHDGGGMHNHNSSPNMVNSILWNNTSNSGTGGMGSNGGSSIPIVSYSLVQGVDNTASNGLDGTNSNNAPLFADAANGDYTLLAGSPGINAGSNAAYTTAGGDLTTDVDLAGNPRVHDYTSGGLIDMGAYESMHGTLPNLFITTWETTAANENITIPTTGTGYNYTVDWGDGNTDSGVPGDATHTYTTPGVYTVKIHGDFPRIFFNNVGDKHKIKTIEQWGTNIWTSMNRAFFGCSNLTYNATDVPNLSLVTDMSKMFSYAYAFNGNIGNWDVGNVTNMAGMFEGAYTFNQDISSWNISNATDISYMFNSASSFNQDIGSWDVSNVTSIAAMFEYALAFNQDIGSWNVSNVTDISYMFSNASAFNQDIGSWNVGNVIYMVNTFNGTASFDQNLGSWDVSNVVNLNNMFFNAALSTANYDALLNGWGSQTLKNNVNFHAGNSTYCAGETARDNMINNFGWNITDGGLDCSDPCGAVTEYASGSWSNGVPNATKKAIFWDDYNTALGNIDACVIEIRPGVTVTVSEGTTIRAEYAIDIDGELVFLSSDIGNGELAVMGSNAIITGNATVHRYMMNKRSYRMVSPSVTTTGSIRENWQEGANNLIPGQNINPNPGFGTHITGSQNGADGFDATATGNPSLFTVDVANQQFQAVGNTDVGTLTAGEGYLMFVRGDRSIDLNSNEAFGFTILRATGQLVVGDQNQTFNAPVVPAPDQAYVMFGNPYQSAVDIQSVMQNSTNVNTDYYYVYDPSLGDYGGYVTVGYSLPPNSLGGTNTSGSSANKFLQPGQGGQVTALTDGHVSVNFQESHKSPGQITATNATGGENVMEGMLVTQLYTAENHLIGGSVHDSFGILFDQTFSNALTTEDAPKLFNFGENLGIDHDGTYLSLERRYLPQPGERFALYVSGYGRSEYVLKIEMTGLERNSFYLLDEFTGTTTILPQGITQYSFTVDSSNTASVASDRFSIIVGDLLDVGENDRKWSLSLYPNPMDGDNFQIHAPGFDGEQLSVRISDLSGRILFDRELDCRANTVVVPFGEGISTGAYLVAITHNGHSQTYRLIKE